MNKKLLLGLSSMVAVATPIATVIACGSEESDTIVLKVATNALAAATRAEGDEDGTDINVEDFADALTTENVDAIKGSINKIKGKAKVMVEVQYNDATIKVDVGLAHKEGKAIKITVNKVYLNKKDGSAVTVNDKGTKVSAFKKYVRKYLRGIYELTAEETGKTGTELLDAIKTKVAAASDAVE